MSKENGTQGVQPLFAVAMVADTYRVDHTTLQTKRRTINISLASFSYISWIGAYREAAFRRQREQPRGTRATGAITVTLCA